MCFGDLAETLTSVAILEDGDTIDVERPTADMSSFQAGATHACAHPLDDEISLQFGDGYEKGLQEAGQGGDTGEECVIHSEFS
jgi:hypothetical protein